MIARGAERASNAVPASRSIRIGVTSPSSKGTQMTDRKREPQLDPDPLPQLSLEDGRPLYTPRDQVRHGYMGAITRTPTASRTKPDRRTDFATWLGRYPRSWE